MAKIPRLGDVHSQGSMLRYNMDPWRDCQKTSQKMSGTEQRGVCAGGKKPTARSINRILKLFESFKIRTAGRKYFFDTLPWLFLPGITKDGAAFADCAQAARHTTQSRGGKL